jgi:hypothetical protein
MKYLLCFLLVTKATALAPLVRSRTAFRVQPRLFKQARDDDPFGVTNSTEPSSTVLDAKPASPEVKPEPFLEQAEEVEQKQGTHSIPSLSKKLYAFRVQPRLFEQPSRDDGPFSVTNSTDPSNTVLDAKPASKVKLEPLLEQAEEVEQKQDIHPIQSLPNQLYAFHVQPRLFERQPRDDDPFGVTNNTDPSNTVLDAKAASEVKLEPLLKQAQEVEQKPDIFPIPSLSKQLYYAFRVQPRIFEQPRDDNPFGVTNSSTDPSNTVRLRPRKSSPSPSWSKRKK